MSSAEAPPLLRLSTAGVDARLRPQLVGDVMARQLAGGVIHRIEATELHCDWQLAAIGPGTVIAVAEQGGLVGTRDAGLVRDGDDDVSLFFGRRGEARIEQNDRRVRLRPGDAIVVAHGRPVTSAWPDNDAVVLRLPRAAFRHGVRIDDTGGIRLDTTAGATRLLTTYVDATLGLAHDGLVPAVAARHLAELASIAVGEALGSDGGAGTRRVSRGAVAAARVAAMREVMARAFADPGLTMARVAHAIGVSERSGYLAFAALDLVFSDELTALRLDRAREALLAGPRKIVDVALAVGFADLSHFNRRFRERFGATPSEVRRRG